MDASSNVNCSDYVPTRTDQATTASSSSAPQAPIVNVRRASAGNDQRAAGNRTDAPFNDSERPAEASYPSLHEALPDHLPSARSTSSESIRSIIRENIQTLSKDPNTLIESKDDCQFAALQLNAITGNIDPASSFTELRANADFPNK